MSQDIYVNSLCSSSVCSFVFPYICNDVINRWKHQRLLITKKPSFWFHTRMFLVFFSQLCCLSFNLRLLIIPLVSSFFFSCSILGSLYSYFYVLFYIYSWFLLLDMPWMISYITEIRTWWRLLQKCVVHTKLDMYIFITISGSIPLLVDY